MKTRLFSINFFEIILIIFLIYLIIILILFIFQRNLLYHPKINKYYSQSLDHEIKNIYIGKKHKLKAWYHFKNNRYKTLLFFHGNAGNLENRIYKLNEISKLNINYLIFAYRGFDNNPGKPSELVLYEDANSAISWLNSNNIPDSKIILYGESLGTAVAIHIAQNKKFAGLILESPFTSMIEMGKKYYPFLPVKFILKDKFDSINKVDKLVSPVLLMHGKNDKIVPFSMGKTLFDKLKVKKFSYFNEFGDHMMEFDENLILQIKNFLKNLS